MRREAIALVFAMGIGAVLTAACDKPPPTEIARRPASSPTTVAPAPPRPDLGNPTQAERKEGSMPVQGEVDPKEAAQRRDFEQKK
jgi:hypothetical protein